MTSARKAPLIELHSLAGNRPVESCSSSLLLTPQAFEEQSLVSGTKKQVRPSKRPKGGT